MKIQENITLAPYTTFKLGGSARYFVSVKNEAELMEAVEYAHKEKMPFFVLGGGSNILISDDGFFGLVIKNEIKGISLDSKFKIQNSKFITVGAGEVWDDVVVEAIKHNLWGLENLSSIPGTVGASPVQNIGAYGCEIKDVIESVRVFDPKEKLFKILSNTDCAFAYRTSIFKSPAHEHLIITSVTFKLSSVPKPDLSYKDLLQKFGPDARPSLGEIREEVIRIRKGKFPDLSLCGTAGSFWKNPIISEEKFNELKSKWPDIPAFTIPDSRFKIPLAWILDNVLKLKGYSKGKARLFEKQPLVVVAEKGSSFVEVDMLATDVEKKVFEAIGIKIEREVVALPGC